MAAETVNKAIATKEAEMDMLKFFFCSTRSCAVRVNQKEEVKNKRLDRWIGHFVCLSRSTSQSGFA